MIYFIIMNRFLEHKYTLPAIIALSLILRIVPAFFAVQTPDRLLRPDSTGYLAPAQELAECAKFSTTRRPPGYPLFAAAVYFCGGNNQMIAFIQVIISAAAVAVTAAAASQYAGSKKCGNIAALLAALNITAIANAPLLLSDTFFTLFAALQFLFFVKYYRSSMLRWIIPCAVTAAAASLIRPINQLFIIVLVFLIFTVIKLDIRKKFIHSAAIILLFYAIITPWMARNYYIGATFDIDTNTGAMRHQNGAMLMAKINGTDFETEKKHLLKIENETFKNTEKFPDERSREKWRKSEFKRMIRQYPFTFFMQQFDARVLLPDAPTLLENFGITSSDRGTMGILKKYGLYAAVKHYFGENWLYILLFLIPLLIPVAILYLANAFQLCRDMKNWKKQFPELLIFLAFAEYYLFLPGAITAPRYQLPALPCMCTIAACAMTLLLNRKNSPDEEIHTEI